VLLDRGLGHDQLVGDVLGRRGGDEGLVPQRRSAQRRQHLDLAPGEVGRGHTAQLDGLVGGGLGRGQPADAGARGAEAQHVAVLEDPAADRATVDAGPVGRQAQVRDVDVRPTPDELGVQPRDARVVQRDVDPRAATDGGHLAGQLEHGPAVLDPQVGRVHVAPFSNITVSLPTYPRCLSRHVTSAVTAADTLRACRGVRRPT
jgi:hypothetical protein